METQIFFGITPINNIEIKGRLKTVSRRPFVLQYGLICVFRF
ncbi:hypothetical protein NEIMUCOT_05194 [Neisseria mucosa ATCC 25996]|uniref:Uncharacterized protein n=1 Tax=Neisseria mucosa (strain ATCC 25996 / DSM 4631 / NCTC 10774 / M26) TaxID=546266 RepID=D2ZX45_NEIM2|nr:hypothetical protein NEIMUCOT_05194 [Neisseria mucosa ATCC 25996]